MCVKAGCIFDHAEADDFGWLSTAMDVNFVSGHKLRVLKGHLEYLVDAVSSVNCPPSSPP